MKTKLFTTLIALFAVSSAMAQNTTFSKSMAPAGNATQPFLFSVNTYTADAPFLSVSASGNLAEHTTGAFGYDGVDQQLAVKGYLGNRFTLVANADLGFSRTGSVNSAQQAEVIRDVIGGKSFYGARFGVGLGANRDFSNVGAMFSRVTAAFEEPTWRAGANFKFEKAFAKDRDDIDLITSVGYQHRIAGAFFAGVEAVGEDLEGFWETDEAEGGAKVLLGPSLNYAPMYSKFSFSLTGGPVFYATHSTALGSEAIRDIGTNGTQNGYSIRAMVAFNLHQ
ncbi:hypothetical protein [Mucilaginibacter sp. dw_454]|uniref:hypothetical protein n=1 Tax=Mucilaginibacter sp. dw_454 TaxID=2720079 RepID=UPI001BD5A9D7|nr:hypothetical protein [Mucilaginibacter sp. dw_454]